jgi:hypothetical protein
MAGHGGHKHRKIALNQKRKQARRKAAANVARVRAQFEEKGQAWAPLENANQLAALNHLARRHVSKPVSSHH